MTRGELLDRIGSRELVEWEAYERVAGPLGAARFDRLFADLMTLTANVNRPGKQRPYRVEQFMPQWDPEAPKAPRQQTPEEQLRAVKAMHRQMSRGRGRQNGNAG